jgi:hypothetical protein
MIRTIKNITITATICFSMIVVLQSISGAENQDEGQRIYLQRHIEKVKVQNPREYQEMMDKAGGVIINCLSCHEEEFMGTEGPKDPFK